MTKLLSLAEYEEYIKLKNEATTDSSVRTKVDNSRVSINESADTFEYLTLI